jgi:hypothetical protein
VSIPDHLVNQILVKSGRRCCICRRFRPTRIQVHHIIARSEGGPDDPGNLMPICMSCHTDVHSRVPFARRFSPDELRAHRDELFRLVADGKLPTGSEDSPGPLQVFNGRVLDTAFPDLPGLTAEAALIVVAAAESLDGLVTIKNLGRIAHVQGGSVSFTNAESSHRECAKYRAAVELLLSLGLIRRIGHRDEIFELTDLGYAVADDIQVSGTRADGTR